MSPRMPHPALPSRRRTSRLARTLALPIGLALALSACNDADTGSTAGPDTPSSAGSTRSFPVTLTNCGREITVDAPPQRVVSLNQGSTEILLSLGLQDSLVGTATWTDPVLPELEDANSQVPRLADNAPSKEVLLDTEPDFVTASFANTFGEGGVITPDELDKLHVGSYLSPAECLKDNEGDGDGERSGTLEIETIYTEITELATIFGVPERGKRLVADLEDRMSRAAGTGSDVSALFWFANAESPYLAGCCGGPGIVSRTLGIENVFDDTTEEWPQINWETVADRDPDVLVLGDLTRKSQTAETGAAKIEFLRSNPVTSKMRAVRENRFVLLSGAELNPSIRTVHAVENVAQQLRDLGLSGTEGSADGAAAGDVASSDTAQ